MANLFKFANCKITGHNYHNLFNSHIIPEIIVQLTLKFIHTLPIDNPPPAACSICHKLDKFLKGVKGVSQPQTSINCTGRCLGL